MSAPLRIVDLTSCPCCGDQDNACECVTCGRCGEVVPQDEARFYAWLGRNGKWTCIRCEWAMALGRPS